MRRHGTLTRWNTERGFGFITPTEGGDPVFVHVTAFPRDGRQPVVGERVSFELEASAEGKARAVRVLRPGQAGHRGTPARSRPGRPATGRPRSRRLLGTAALLAVVTAGVYLHSRLSQPPAQADAPAPFATLPAARPAPAFRCEGRTHCSQMRSCEEATWVLQHCPNTAMDGDRDGVPCESQWCAAR